jgi:fumarate reductase subunit D
MILNETRTTEFVDQLLYCAALAISIELVLFKFLPDIATAVMQTDTSSLADFKTFENTYLVPGSVFHPRFLGNYILYSLAKFIAGGFSSPDVRLHPLRIAAGILTPLYACLGAAPVLIRARSYDWRAFLVPYALAVIMGLYVFYPCDIPALACLSAGIFFLLQERLALALLFMLLVGLYRESSFHMVWLVAAWAICARSPNFPRRASWVVIFGAAFLVEYLAIRRYFPGPVAAGGGLIFDPIEIFLGRGMLSLTAICSLSLATLFPLACWAKLRSVPPVDWRTHFFILNCAVFPLWIVFYRILNGNVSEFRIFFPAIIPCIYGIAYAAANSSARQPSASCTHSPAKVVALTVVE